jgi:hypothetical protein
MLLDTIFAPFVKERPICVMARAVLERLLDAQRIDALFARTAQQQYTRELMFSSLVGRVLGACGYYFGTSPKPSASSDSAGYKPSKSVVNLSLAPVGLYLSALSPFIPPILNQYPVLDHLHLGPRWHAVEQHLCE